jgi:hypothetical protein
MGGRRRLCVALSGMMVGSFLFLSLGVGAGHSTSSPHGTQEGDRLLQRRGGCSLLDVQARKIRVYRLDDPYYDYRAKGRAYVPKVRPVRGCTLIICLGEELGAGHWVGSWCEHRRIRRDGWFSSFPPPYIPCEDYDGTGWFRSYLRFEGSSVKELGLETRLCRNGKPVY